MTREEAFKEINETQDFYVNELINKINDSNEDYMKVINFQSPTGTGKTKMMSKLINKMPDIFFIITTLSKGQLDKQIEANIKADCKYDNYKVYGTQKFTITSKLQADEILSLIPENKTFIWLRDEGHINTNRWETLLKDKAYKMINITATPDHADIKCNFTNTMMLRTVHQNVGTPEEAILKLLEVKKQHKKVKDYNPCAIFRCVAGDNNLEQMIKDLCDKYNLKSIDISEETYNMQDICRDNNEYDVIINKFKIVEGIDIRRAHILFMDNQPSNNSTTIQVIGRCRRNALLYRNDIDIFDKKNEKLLENTRTCFVFYNVEQMHIDEDKNGELATAFCDIISVEQLKTDSIVTVKNGVLSNGLTIIELKNESGTFRVLKDKETGFNIIKLEGNFYDTEIGQSNSQFVALKDPNRNHYYICSLEELYTVSEQKISIPTFNFVTGEVMNIDRLARDIYEKNKKIVIRDSVFVNKFLIELKNLFSTNFKKYTYNDKAKLSKYKYSWFPTFYASYLDNLSVDNYYESFSTVEQLEKITPKQLLNLCTITGYGSQKSFKTKEAAEKAKQDFLSELNNELIKRGIVKNGSFKQIISEPKVHLEDIFPTGAKKFPCILLLVDKDEKYAHYVDLSERSGIAYYNYTKILNDRESAIVGTDLMHKIKTDDNKEIWVEQKAITSKVKRACKLNTFIENRYEKYIDEVRPQLFNGQNKFNFDNKCSSCLGYCVEYVAKYLIYGQCYLDKQLKEARKEAKITNDNFINNNLIIRAALLKYKELMIAAYGSNITKVIKTISVQQLIQTNYKEFVNTVMTLASKAADFIKGKMNITHQIMPGDKLYDLNLSIKHIAGLADFINKNMIIDIKVTNSIEMAHIKQVLAYHYLSTKRSDLDIKIVIVYEAVSGRFVEINLDKKD